MGTRLSLRMCSWGVPILLVGAKKLVSQTITFLLLVVRMHSIPHEYMKDDLATFVFEAGTLRI